MSGIQWTSLFLAVAIIHATCGTEQRALIFSPLPVSSPTHISVQIMATSGPVTVTLSYLGESEIIPLNPGTIYEKIFDETIWIGNNIERKLVLIESSGPVSVLGWNAGSGISAAFVAPRITADYWEFVVPNYDTTELSESRISVGIFHDYGEVDVKFQAGGGEYRDALTPGDTYTLFDMNDNSVHHPGSIVTSDTGDPIVVYAGHDQVRIPSETESYGHIWDSATPTNLLGTDYIVPPIAGRNVNAGYIVRVFALEHDTEVSQYNSTTGTFSLIDTLRKKAHLEIDHPKTNEHISLKCNKPCSVKQFNKGKAADSTPTGPFMMSIPPLSRYVHTAAFIVPKSSHAIGNSESNYISVVSQSQDFGSLKLNCDGVSAQTWRQSTGHDGYSYTTMSVDSNKIYCLSDNSTNGLFAIWVYGHGSPGNGFGFLATDSTDSNVNSERGQCIHADPCEITTEQATTSFNQPTTTTTEPTTTTTEPTTTTTEPTTTTTEPTTTTTEPTTTTTEPTTTTTEPTTTTATEPTTTTTEPTTTTTEPTTTTTEPTTTTTEPTTTTTEPTTTTTDSTTTTTEPNTTTTEPTTTTTEPTTTAEPTTTTEPITTTTTTTANEPTTSESTAAQTSYQCPSTQINAVVDIQVLCTAAGYPTMKTVSPNLTTDDPDTTEMSGLTTEMNTCDNIEQLLLGQFDIQKELQKQENRSELYQEKLDEIQNQLQEFELNLDRMNQLQTKQQQNHSLDLQEQLEGLQNELQQKLETQDQAFLQSLQQLQEQIEDQNELHAKEHENRSQNLQDQIEEAHQELKQELEQASQQNHQETQAQIQELKQELEQALLQNHQETQEQVGEALQNQLALQKQMEEQSQITMKTQKNQSQQLQEELEDVKNQIQLELQETQREMQEQIQTQIQQNAEQQRNQTQHLREQFENLQQETQQQLQHQLKEQQNQTQQLQTQLQILLDNQVDLLEKIQILLPTEAPTTLETTPMNQTENSTLYFSSTTLADTNTTRFVFTSIHNQTKVVARNLTVVESPMSAYIGMAFLGLVGVELGLMLTIDFFTVKSQIQLCMINIKGTDPNAVIPF